MVAQFTSSVNNMTTTTATTSRPRLLTPALLLLFAANIGSATSFYLLLSVVPAYAGTNAAGTLTATLMFATVAGELATPRLAARHGDRATLAAGLLALGAPALLLTLPANTTIVLAVCLVRGLGFAITVVIGGALTATLIPDGRRGEGLGIAGIVAGIPAVIALPGGVWLATHIGTTPVFIAGAASALAGIAAVAGLPATTTTIGAAGILTGLRTATLRRPTLVFSVTTMAVGILVTFLPLAAGATAAAALFAQSAATTIARWQAGRHSDRHHPAGQLIPGLATAAAGMLTLAIASGPALTIAGALLFGTGFGITQNATLTLMYRRVRPADYSTASALWNLGYDGGMGIGAAGFGILAGHTGIHTAFAITAVTILLFLAPAQRDRSTPIQTQHQV